MDDYLLSRVGVIALAAGVVLAYVAHGMNELWLGIGVVIAGIVVARLLRRGNEGGHQ